LRFPPSYRRRASAYARWPSLTQCPHQTRPPRSHRRHSRRPAPCLLWCISSSLLLSASSSANSSYRTLVSLSISLLLCKTAARCPYSISARSMQTACCECSAWSLCAMWTYNYMNTHCYHSPTESWFACYENMIFICCLHCTRSNQLWWFSVFISFRSIFNTHIRWCWWAFSFTCTGDRIIEWFKALKLVTTKNWLCLIGWEILTKLIEKLGLYVCVNRSYRHGLHLYILSQTLLVTLLIVLFINFCSLCYAEIHWFEKELFHTYGLWCCINFRLSYLAKNVMLVLKNCVFWIIKI